MRYIQKSAPPSSLIQVVKNGLQGYEELPNTVKKDIQRQLLQDQGGLCAYCMKRIDLNSIQIEHYFPRHPQNPDDAEKGKRLSLDFKNLLGVCDGGKSMGYDGKNLTCDAHRGNAPLTVNPLNRESIRKIKYSHDGTIYSDDESVNHDLNETLNLNSEAANLARNRKSVLDRFIQSYIMKKYANKRITKEEWHHLYEKTQSRDQDGNLLPYVGILEYFIHKKFNTK